MELNEQFIGKCFKSSAILPSDNDYFNVGIYSKNTIFFYNTIIELISYESNYGTRIKVDSLLSLINYEIDYFCDISKMDGSKTIPADRKKYVINRIKESKILSKTDVEKYILLLNNVHNSSDNEYISVLKLINISLKEGNRYFKEVSDCLCNLLFEESANFDVYSKIDLYTREYISLLMHFGLSIKAIRDVFKDCLRSAIENRNQGHLLKFFTEFGDLIKRENKFTILVKMKKGYDESIIKSLKLGKNNQFQVLSKKGAQSICLNATNKSQLDSILAGMDKDTTNPSYLKYEVKAFDKWQAIIKFKYNCLQPYLGSLIYSGIYDKMSGEKFIVMHNKNGKIYIREYKNNEDVFSPINQSRISYTGLYKRYIIKSQQNQIQSLIDEVISLLPAYLASTNSLSRFSNVWFAFESLFKNSSDTIVNSLNHYAVPVITDKYIAGYLKITHKQYLCFRKNMEALGTNRIESSFNEMFSDECRVDSEFLLWKIQKINLLITNYSKNFDSIQKSVQYHVSNIYHQRNKQFHGIKGIDLDYSIGYIYDMVNEILEYLMDYMDVYKNKKDSCNLNELYSSMTMIKQIKKVLLDDNEKLNKKVGILVDSIRII